MCCYCATGDFIFRHYPPFPVDPFTFPTVPQPIIPMPYQAWDLAKLREYLELLEKIKEMEDKLGCPCEPNKADYIGMLKTRIEELQKRV